MPVFIKVSQNKIKDSKSFGKWYGRVATTPSDPVDGDGN